MAATIRELNTVISSSTKEVVSYRNLTPLLSPGQVNMLKMNHRKKHWTPEELNKALSLYCVSSKAYDFLRKEWKYPIPCKTTLLMKISKFNFSPGLLTPVLRLLEAEFYNESLMRTSAVLGLDEVEIDDSYCYDKSEDKVLGGNKKLLCICVRGLFKNWKQIIYYDFNERVTADTIKMVISELGKVGISIVAMVNDLDTVNTRTWKDLGISLDKTSFAHPQTGEPVYVFGDMPHLIKLLRNHLLDTEFRLQDGTRITKACLQEIIRLDSAELKVCPKLTMKHLEMEKRQRQRVRPAFQVFSNTVSKALTFFNITNSKVADFFDLVNNYSDLMNSSVYVKNDKFKFKSSFGVFPVEQEGLLYKLIEEITRMEVGPALANNKKKALKPFQRAMVISSKSMIGLYNYMKGTLGPEVYILTRHLTQDYIESSFSRFRGFGAFNMKPNALEAKHRVRKLVLCWQAPSSNGSNISDEGADLGFLSAKLFSKPTSKIGNTLEDHTQQKETVDLGDFAEEFSKLDLRPEPQEVSSSCKVAAQDYVAGYISRKFIKEYPHFASDTNFPGWISHLSNGSLIEPSDYMKYLFLKFETEFNLLHSNKLGRLGINTSTGIVQKLVQRLSKSLTAVPPEVIEFYSRVRTLIRVKSMNKMLSDAKVNKSQHWKKRKEQLDKFVRSLAESSVNRRDCSDEDDMDYDVL